ncbi:Protein of unknown function (DUF1191 [Striga hermonthica]|uniref:Uncharacterized protein n=1 Tax=Striga hermonthica TaxID=68872 RepID=A0A9N7N4Y1_STRHE|nr:Protein of unknown function (DUF1191 [Striga hermonthica]
MITLFLLLLATTTQSLSSESRAIKSAKLLDLVIRDYTFRSQDSRKNFKTGRLYPVDLPSNLSGIQVDVVRFRCGSLRRYGADIKEFRLRPGTHARSCSKRVILVRQNLGSNWSSLYNENYELSGYRLISPILGLLAYGVGCTNRSATPEVEIQAGKNPITIDFRAAGLNNASQGIIPLCAVFDEGGRMSLSDPAGPGVCASGRQGHFGLVVEAPLMPLRRKAGRARVAVGIAAGAALGAFLLGLLAVAVVANARKRRKEREEEMERRAYEEEALRVSMVGHVRAVAASATRTMPRIEHFERRRRPDTRSSS